MMYVFAYETLDTTLTVTAIGTLQYSGVPNIGKYRVKQDVCTRVHMLILTRSLHRITFVSDSVKYYM